jgi:hypothetical protein
MPEPLFQLSIHTTHIGGTHNAALCHRIAPKKGGNLFNFAHFFRKISSLGTAHTSKRGQRIAVSGTEMIPSGLGASGEAPVQGSYPALTFPPSSS